MNIDPVTYHEWKKSHLNEIEENLRSLINIKNKQFSGLQAALQFSLLNRGKRIRPLLCVSAGEIAKAPSRQLKMVACLIEMIHIFSLCQDDLPAMDNDDYRQGKKSVHSEYGTTMALLICDYLITQAYTILGNLDLPDYKIVNLLRVLSKNIGIFGMTGGQYLDIYFTGSSVKLNDVEYLAELKTASLIKASLEMGFICGQCENEDIKSSLDIFGSNIGIAYQIIDDISDITCNYVDLGKTPQKDIRDNKATFVSILGVDESRRRAIALIKEAIESISFLGKEANNLINIANSIMNIVK